MLNIITAHRGSLCAVAAWLLLVAGCTRDVATPAGPARGAPPARNRHVAAVVEITFNNIGSPNMTSSAIVGTSVAAVEARRAALERAAKNRVRFSLTAPADSNGQGDSTIQLRFNNADAVTDGTTRYFEATYLARNAQKTDSVAFNTPRRNLTFIAVSDNRTLNGTPVLVFNKSDGTAADPALTLQLKPTGLVTANGGAAVVPVSPDVMQIFTEPEIAAIALRPPDVTNVFPYGFVVRHRDDPTNRLLTASPDTNVFDGIVTFAFRVPLQTPSANDPTSITLLMLALDDDVTKITQSLEEQTPPGPDSVAARAALLDAAQVRVLAGGSVPTTIPIQAFCSVRTAGPAGAPTATLLGTGASVDVLNPLTPNPYAAAGNRIALSQAISANFTSAVSGAGPSNFVVRGLQSGQKFRGQTYPVSSGTTVTTPAGAFKLGEDVDVTLTASLTCPAWVGRLKVGAFTASNPNLGGRTNLTVGGGASGMRAVAVADFTGDGSLDLALRIAGTNAVIIATNNGGGNFSNSTTIPAVGTNTNTGGIVATDINGDGNLDLAFLNGDNVLVYLGGPAANTPTFTAAAGFPSVGSAPQDLAVGDFNGDGIPDLVVTFPDHVAVLISNGQGGFAPPVTIATGAGTRATAVGDLNRDGKFDLVVANANGNIAVYLGNGDGTFSTGPTVSNGTPIAGLAIGDVNNDGILDVVTADSTANTVSVRLGTGNGNLGSPIVTTGFPAGGSTSAVILADMNGDGNLDVLLGAAAGSASVAMAFGNGAGGFGTPITAGNNGVTQIVAPEISGSNNLDIVAMSGGTQTSIGVWRK